MNKLKIFLILISGMIISFNGKCQPSWVKQSPNEQVEECVKNAILLIEKIITIDGIDELCLHDSIGKFILSPNLKNYDIELIPINSGNIKGETRNDTIYLKLNALEYEDLCISTILHQYEAKIENKVIKQDTFPKIFGEFETFEFEDPITGKTAYLNRIPTIVFPKAAELKEKIMGNQFEYMLSSRQTPYLKIKDDHKINILLNLEHYCKALEEILRTKVSPNFNISKKSGEEIFYQINFQ